MLYPTDSRFKFNIPVYPTEIARVVHCDAAREFYEDNTEITDIRDDDAVVPGDDLDDGEYGEIR